MKTGIRLKNFETYSVSQISWDGVRHRLPSQCWFTRLVGRIAKNNIERGAGEGHFRLGCEVSPTKLDLDCSLKSP